MPAYDRTPPKTPVDAAGCADLIQRALGEGRTELDEWQAKSVLAAYGISVPESKVAHSPAEAVVAADRLGGKVAMKAVGVGIQHKTELGLVVLGVQRREQVEETYRELRQRAGDAFEGVLVERMVAGTREFMLGMKRDSLFGPVIAFGLGGVLTEALADVALAVAPLDAAEAAELPGLIRSRRLLGAFRGSPPVDRQALTRVIQALSRIAVEHPNIAEIDVNPLLIEGDRPVAADALMILSQSPVARAIESDFQPRLEAVLSPESVAVIGASDDLRKWGGSALRSIMDGGYSGRVYAVNPRGGEFFGVRAYPSLEELPEVPELVLLAVGSDRVLTMLEQCGRLGVQAAVVITAGFSETGAKGAEAEREIARVSAEAGMTLIGPNCIGVISNECGLHAIGFIVSHPKRGKLSVVSQSGNIGVQMVKACERREIGVEKLVSVGNEAQVGAIDVLEYLADDENSECAVLYVEGLDDGHKFLDSMRRASAAKPVVVLRGGLTEQGSEAAASHTGAMAGSAVVFEAAIRQAGAIMCTSPQKTLDLALAFSYLPLPSGRRVAVVTNGGGVGVLTADEVARHGLVLASLPESLFAALDPLLPPFYSRRNPLDMVASAGGDVGPRIVEEVARCEWVDSLVVLSVLGVANAGDDDRALAGDGSYANLSPWEISYLSKVAELMEETGKPIVNVYDNPVRQAVFDTGRRYSPIIVSSPETAAFVLDRLAWYAEHRTARAVRAG